MAQYLVIATFTLDDIPVLLTNDRDEAIALAREIEADIETGEHGEPLHPMVGAAVTALGRDSSCQIGVVVMEFSGAGVPLGDVDTGTVGS